MTFRMSSCDKIWNLPSDATAFDRVYTNGDSTLTIEIQGVDLNNCPFEIDVGILDSGGTSTPLDTQIFTINQPELTQDVSDNMLVSVTKLGNL